MESDKVTLNERPSVLDEFSLRMERPLLHKDKPVHDDLISFDFDAKLFFIKEDDKGRYFYSLSREFKPSEKLYFKDEPGQQFYGIYITATGKYLYNLQNCQLYENQIPFESFEEMKVFLESNLANDFIQNLPQRGLLQRYGCNYDEWYSGVRAVFERDASELAAAGLVVNQVE